MSPSYQIMHGEIHHLGQVMNLINELALFEKEPASVINTTSQLEKDFKTKLFNFFVVELENTVIGFALCYYRYSTWKGKCLFLEDFYIQEKYRSQGIGAQLFDAVINNGKQEKCTLLNWQVLDWNKRAIDFYKLKGADISEIWYNGTLKL